MTFSDAHVHIYFKFYQQLKNDILLRELAPGERLPTIAEMQKLYGVSNGTVRRGLDLLQHEGFITKKRGAGCFVREDVDLPLWTPSSAMSDILNDLKNVHIEHLSDGWVAPPRRVERVFAGQEQVLRDGKIYKIRQLTYHEQVTRWRSFTDNYLPDWFYGRLEPGELKNTSVLSAMARLTDLKSTRGRMVIRPWLCDFESADILQLPEGTPIFHRSWISRDEKKRVIFYAESLLTHNALSLDMDIQVNPAPTL